MRTVLERDVDVIGGTTFNVQTRTLGIRSMEVLALQNDDATVTIRTFMGGNSTPLVVGQPVLANLGAGAYFGGPVIGEFIQISIAGAGTHKFFFRFFAEHQRPFGSFLTDAFEDLAIPIGATAATKSIQNPGAWARRTSILWQADDQAALLIGSVFGSITTPLSAYTSNNPSPSYSAVPIIPSFPTGRIDLAVQNLAAAPIDSRIIVTADCT